MRTIGRRRLRKGQVLLAALFVSAATGYTAVTRGTDLVTVHSAARPDYLARKFVEGGPTPETYVFAQGKFFGGATRDVTVAQTSFDIIVQTLAEELVRQNYFPTKEIEAADLLLMVHWGTTMVQEDFDALEAMEEAFNSGEMTEEEVNFFQLMRETEATSLDYTIGYNSRLLGYTDALEKEHGKFTGTGTTGREQELKHQLNQERYFIIVMAYDYRRIRDTTEKVLLWSTRFSMRTPGKNFAEALPAMSRVAGDHFGTDLRDLATKRTHIGEGRVELGDIEVIEIESPPAPPVPPPPVRK